MEPMKGSKPDKKDKPKKDKPLEVDMEPAKGSKPDKSKPGKNKPDKNKPGKDKPDKDKPGKDKPDRDKPDKQSEPKPFDALLDKLGLSESDLTPRQDEYLHAMTEGKIDLSQYDGPGLADSPDGPVPAPAVPDPTAKPTRAKSTKRPVAEPTRNPTRNPTRKPTRKPTAQPTAGSHFLASPPPTKAKDLSGPVVNIEDIWGFNFVSA